MHLLKLLNFVSIFSLELLFVFCIEQISLSFPPFSCDYVAAIAPRNYSFIFTNKSDLLSPKSSLDNLIIFPKGGFESSQIACHNEIGKSKQVMEVNF